MSIGILKGFALGSVFTDVSGSRVLLPFLDVVEATLSYTGELVTAETFNDAGVLSTSRACLASESLTLSLNTNSLTWSTIQATATSFDTASTANRITQEVVTLTEVDATPASTYTLSQTPITDADELTALGLPALGVIVSDENGNQIVPASLTGTALVFSSDLTGTRVMIQYAVAPGASDRQIDLGSANNRFGNAGIYGRFFGCPGTIIAVLDDVAIAPSVDASVDGSSGASFGLTATALRGSKGYLARLIWTP